MDLAKLEEVLRRNSGGEPITRLCKELGLSRNVLYAYCKRNKIALRSKYVYKPYRRTKEERRSIAQEYLEGASTSGLATKHGLSHHVICRYVREFNNIRTAEENWALFGRPDVNAIMGAYRREASKRKLVFGLTYAEFERLVFSSCYYCNSSGSPRGRLGTLLNGVDRVNNAVGYVAENVVAACGRCNSAKNDMTVNEFASWIRKLYTNLGKIDALIKT